MYVSWKPLYSLTVLFNSLKFAVIFFNITLDILERYNENINVDIIFYINFDNFF